MISRLTLSCLLLLACGPDEPMTSPGSDSPELDGEVTTVPDGTITDVTTSDVTAPDMTASDTASDTAPAACPSGHIEGPAGDCMAVGIQGCDDMFIDPETGMCDPSFLDCPPGQMQIYGGDDQGCRSIGIVDCHPDFLDSATGRCDPPPGRLSRALDADPHQGVRLPRSPRGVWRGYLGKHR